MLLNLFTKKPFSPQNLTSSSQEIFCTLEEKDALRKREIKDINSREKAVEARNLFK